MHVIEKYQEFEGRASRAEFWWFNLVLYSIQIAIVAIGALLSTFASTLETVATVVLWGRGLVLLLPQIAVSARRLHDTGRRGWWMLLLLIPIIGWITLLIFLVLSSDTGPNDYGHQPVACITRRDSGSLTPCLSALTMTLKAELQSSETE